MTDKEFNLWAVEVLEIFYGDLLPPKLINPPPWPLATFKEVDSKRGKA